MRVLDDTVIKEMESTLQRYYRKIEELQSKRKALETVEKNADDIRRILLDVNQLIPSNGTVANYNLIVAESSGRVYDTTAQAYNEFSRSVEKFERELVTLLQKKIKLKMQIMQLEASLEGIGFALNLLDPLDRTICEQYYGVKRKSNLQIGLSLNMDEKSIRYRKKIINQKLSEYLKVRR